MSEDTPKSGFPVQAIVGLAAGLAAGAIGAVLLAPPKVVQAPPEVIKQELSKEELLAICDDTNQDVREALTTAHRKVIDLEGQLEEKEAALTALQKESEGDEARRAAAAKKWNAMEEEIASLRIALAKAEEERDQLMVELKDTVAKLENEIVQKEKAVRIAKKYKKESVENLWKAFSADAKTQICDHGSRKRHENCYGSVESSLVPHMDRFKECVQTYASVPVLKVDDRDQGLPQHAAWLDPDSKYLTEGGLGGKKNAWYVLFCDPSLPEATVSADEMDIPI